MLHIEEKNNESSKFTFVDSMMVDVMVPGELVVSDGGAYDISTLPFYFLETDEAVRSPRDD